MKLMYMYICLYQGADEIMYEKDKGIGEDLRKSSRERNKDVCWSRNRNLLGGLEDLHGGQWWLSCVCTCSRLVRFQSSKFCFCSLYGSYGVPAALGLSTVYNYLYSVVWLPGISSKSKWQGQHQIKVGQELWAAFTGRSSAYLNCVEWYK